MNFFILCTCFEAICLIFLSYNVAYNESVFTHMKNDCI